MLSDAKEMTIIPAQNGWILKVHGEYSDGTEGTESLVFEVKENELMTVDPDLESAPLKDMFATILDLI